MREPRGQAGDRPPQDLGAAVRQEGKRGLAGRPDGERRGLDRRARPPRRKVGSRNVEERRLALGTPPAAARGSPVARMARETKGRCAPRFPSRGRPARGAAGEDRARTGRVLPRRAPPAEHRRAGSRGRRALGTRPRPSKRACGRATIRCGARVSPAARGRAADPGARAASRGSSPTLRRIGTGTGRRRPREAAPRSRSRSRWRSRSGRRRSPRRARRAAAARKPARGGADF